MTAEDQSTARVATFNVLNPGFGTLAPWDDRRANLAETIRASGASVVALQEAGWDRVRDGILPAEDLAALTGLALSEAAFSGDAILYEADVWTPGRAGHFLLPHAYGDRRRSAIWQHFRGTGRELLVLSTHLSYAPERERARTRQARRIVRRAAALNPGGIPTLVMGDLNTWADRGSRTALDVFAAAGYVEAVPTEPNHGTLIDSQHSLRLDHIVASAWLRIIDAGILDPELPGPASDHRLVWADVEWARARPERPPKGA